MWYIHPLGNLVAAKMNEQVQQIKVDKILALPVTFYVFNIKIKHLKQI